MPKKVEKKKEEPKPEVTVPVAKAVNFEKMAKVKAEATYTDREPIAGYLGQRVKAERAERKGK